MLSDLKRPQPSSTLAYRVDRRTFLETATALTAALGIAPATVGINAALAAEPLPPDASTTLLRMAKDTYPHDNFLPDQPYQAVVDAIIEETTKNGAVLVLCVDGLKDVNARSTAIYGKPYTAVTAEEERVAILRAIQLTPFFQKLRVALMMGIYNNKALWPKFGYQGSSWEKDGYLHRGFNDLNWL